MDQYLFRYEDHLKLYNCSVYDVESIPFERRSHPLFGSLLLGLGCVFTVIYIPCFASVCRHMSMPAYKFMFAIGVADLMAIVFGTFVTGLFCVRGVVFCDSPNLLYVFGISAMFSWAIDTVATFLLGVNRCIEMWSPWYADILFKGWRTWAWLLFAFVYAIYFSCFTNPPIFTALYAAWFYNPHVGYIDDVTHTYENKMQTFHNISVVLTLGSVYGVFLVLFLIRGSLLNRDAPGYSESRRSTFIQALLINLMHGTIALTYWHMQYSAYVPALEIYFASLLWPCGAGVTACIYLSMNRTIRRDILRTFVPCRIRIHISANTRTNRITSAMHASNCSAPTNALATARADAPKLG